MEVEEAEARERAFNHISLFSTLEKQPCKKQVQFQGDVKNSGKENSWQVLRAENAATELDWRRVNVYSALSAQDGQNQKSSTPPTHVSRSLPRNIPN